MQKEEVTWIHHWNKDVFSFKTTRSDALRFRSGEFIMLGLEVEGKPLLRAYSMVSPNWADHLEFLSIKVPDGPLTSRLQHVVPGDEVLIGGRPIGTLTIDDLNPGKRLLLFASGTGLAPFMSVLRDPDTYSKFERVYLYHSVRKFSDLAYFKYLNGELEREYSMIEEFMNDYLVYSPTVTQEINCYKGRLEFRRLTEQIEDGTIPILKGDRAMVCGSPSFLADVSTVLKNRRLGISPAAGQLGDFVIERAFVE